MIFFMCELRLPFRFSLKFEQHDLGHTHIEVSFDGFAYRFPKQYMQQWLKFNNLEWDWECKKTEVWFDEPYTYAVNRQAKPPIIRFIKEEDAILFKIAWDGR